MGNSTEPGLEFRNASRRDEAVPDAGRVVMRSVRGLGAGVSALVGQVWRVPGGARDDGAHTVFRIPAFLDSRLPRSGSRRDRPRRAGGVARIDAAQRRGRRPVPEPRRARPPACAHEYWRLPRPTTVSGIRTCRRAELAARRTLRSAATPDAHRASC